MVIQGPRQRFTTILHIFWKNCVTLIWKRIC